MSTFTDTPTAPLPYLAQRLRRCSDNPTAQLSDPGAYPRHGDNRQTPPPSLLVRSPSPPKELLAPGVPPVSKTWAEDGQVHLSCPTPTPGSRPNEAGSARPCSSGRPSSSSSRCSHPNSPLRTLSSGRRRGSSSGSGSARPRSGGGAARELHLHLQRSASQHYELTAEDRQSLVSRAGGIGGLPAIRPLGEGGIARVDLVRVTLPSGPTLEMARKTTKPALPAPGGGSVMSRQTGHSRAYSTVSACGRYPFPAFDREVCALKALQPCGLAIGFHAASFDHPAGRGYILMEPAPYGTLEDLVQSLDCQRRKRRSGAARLLSACFGRRGSDDGGGGGEEPQELTRGSQRSGGALLMSVDALRYYGGVALQALACLHKAGYVHRDVKLSNMLLIQGGRMRLADLSAAAAACTERGPGLYSGPMAGTELYLAPEQLQQDRGAAARAASASRKVHAEAGSNSGGGAAAAFTPRTRTTSTMSYGITRGNSIGTVVCTEVVDTYGVGLMLVQAALGWAPEELWSRVVQPLRSGAPVRLPDMPPALKDLLLSHVLVRDPAKRYTVRQMQNHEFFKGVDWDNLALQDGPHAHLL